MLHTYWPRRRACQLLGGPKKGTHRGRHGAGHCAQPQIPQRALQQHRPHLPPSPRRRCAGHQGISTPPPPHKPMRALERLNLQHQLAHHTTLKGFVRCVQFQGPGPAAALDTVRTGCICQSKHLRSRGMLVLGFSCVLASLDRKPARGTAFGFCGIRIPCVSCDFTSGVMYPHDHVCRCIVFKLAGPGRPDSAKVSDVGLGAVELGDGGRLAEVRDVGAAGEFCTVRRRGP